MELSLKKNYSKSNHEKASVVILTFTKHPFIIALHQTNFVSS